MIQRPVDDEYGYTMRSVRRPFYKKFPTAVGLIIGVLQMLLNGGIVGLEGGSVAYNPKYDIVYAGFWCSVSFFIAWVAIFAFLFFRKTLRWGLAVAGVNCVSIAFAIILIVFDSLFIQYPCQCYLGTVCYLPSSADLTNCTNVDAKLRLVKAQLALTATMLTSNILYVIIFVIIAVLTRNKYKSLTPAFQPMPSPQHSSSKVLTHSQMHIPEYSPPPPQQQQQQTSYEYSYRQPTYADQRDYWRPASPYFNRIEKF